MKDQRMLEYCMCSMGVCQCDNISPLLFVLFLYDFTHNRVHHGLKQALNGINIMPQKLNVTTDKQ